MRYLNELREGEAVKEIYLCKQFLSLKTKNGKTYYSITLQDKTGTFDAKVWELGPGIEHFENMDYIRIEGMVTSFQGALQLNVSRIRRCQEGEYDPSDYMPATKKDIEQMYKEFVKYIASVKEPHLKQLAENFFVNDKKTAEDFKKHSAAKSVHHGFIGGLLEHTLGVVKLCDYMSQAYPIINRDLLLVAAMFHDSGKMVELADFPLNDYTDEGNLLGHIFMGAELIGELSKNIEGFPPKVLIQLKHCILAHHGELEFGSPKKPASVEALALSLADNMDAKMETVTELFDSADPSTEWLGYQKLFESNIRRTTGI